VCSKLHDLPCTQSNCLLTIILFVGWSGSYVLSILGAPAKLRKGTINLVMSACPTFRPPIRPSVRPSAWNKRLPLDGFSWNLIFKYSSKICREIQVSLKSDKNNEYFTWRQINIFRHMFLSYSQNERYFRQSL